MRNVCGLDVHKDNVFVCIDKENGEKIQFKTGVLTKEQVALCETLVANDVTEIAMDSTVVYRMSIWRVWENDYKMHLPQRRFLQRHKTNEAAGLQRNPAAS